MRSVNMESKAIKSQCFLTFGLSFNLILTLGSLGFTCYSLHRLDSRVTTVEQNVLLTNPSDQLLSRVTVEPTSAEPHPGGSRIKETVRDKRAADKGSRCRKCRRDCPNSSGVSFFFLFARLSNIIFTNAQRSFEENLNDWNINLLVNLS